MRYRKNKKRIDPRYFLEETATRGKEIEEFQIREGGYAGHHERPETPPRAALLQGIAYAVSRGDFETAYELLATINPAEALAIIEKGLKDHLGVSISIEKDPLKDEIETS